MRFIVAKSVNTTSLGALKKQVAILRRGDIRGEDHNEIANAVIEFVSKYGELRFHNGQFWQWKGACWEVVSENWLVKTIGDNFGAFPACRRYNDYVQIVKQMRTKAEKDLRQYDVFGLNFANGFVTEDLELMEHNPDFGMTYILPYRYLPEQEGYMPIFNQFLVDSWGGDPDFTDKVNALQEAIGATMFGVGTRYQRAFCLYGVPSSGKSQLAAIVTKLMPKEAVSHIAPDTWGKQFVMAGMVDKQMNFAGEMSESKPIPGDMFKKVVAGEKITTEFKGKDQFDYYPTAAQWFCSNHLPKTRDSSDGFNRRWLFLQFNRRVDPAKKVIDLADMIIEHEREAIAAWAVKGFERLRSQGDYTLPSSHMALIDTMAEDNNSVRYFLQNSPKVQIVRDDPAAIATTSELHELYWSFCTATGLLRRANIPTFTKMMEELQTSLGFKRETRPTPQGHAEVVYRGLRIATT
jgi:P4 family phage/plasmid primase-like protien